METLYAAFLRLFTGLQTVHGEYSISTDAPVERGKKVAGQAYTRQAPLTVELLQRHLAPGGFGVGVTPARLDGTCCFAAIDVDQYFCDLKVLNDKIQAIGLPLVLCRTKSGGAHLYLFLVEAAACAMVREKLKLWASLLGQDRQPDKNGREREVEIFPKQDRILSDEDAGSWINLPYQGGENSTRYALGADGKALTPEEFVAYADARAVTVDMLLALQPRPLPQQAGAAPPAQEQGGQAEGEWHESPPCLQTLAGTGAPDGTHNNLVFNIGKYLQNRYGDRFAGHLVEYGKRYAPSQTPAEVRGVIKSLTKKNYSFKCSEEPIHSVCNKALCLTRKFGVGTSVIRYIYDRFEQHGGDPPSYTIIVDDNRFSVHPEDLLDQHKMRLAYMKALGIVPTFLTRAKYDDAIRNMLNERIIIAVPEGATQTGVFENDLQEYCTQGVGRAKEELLRGKPFVENSYVYFSPYAYIRWLGMSDRKKVEERELWERCNIRAGGVKVFKENISGQPFEYWRIDAFAARADPFKVQQFKEEAPF